MVDRDSFHTDQHLSRTRHRIGQLPVTDDRGISQSIDIGRHHEITMPALDDRVSLPELKTDLLQVEAGADAVGDESRAEAGGQGVVSPPSGAVGGDEDAGVHSSEVVEHALGRSRWPGRNRAARAAGWPGSRPCTQAERNGARMRHQEPI